MMAEIKLLPCPFCGEEPYVHEPGFPGDQYQIGCDSQPCGSNDDSDGEGAVWRDGATWEQVAERWNRRAGTDEPEVERVGWVRDPSRDRRIGRGDDWAGDAWRWGNTGEVSYTVVGQGPPSSEGRES